MSLPATTIEPVAVPRLELASLGRWAAYALIAIGALRLVSAAQDAAYRNDFVHYYLSARAMLDGQNPYTTPLQPYCDRAGLEFDQRIPMGTNPPPLMAAVALIAWLPLPLACLVWAWVQGMSLVGLFSVSRRLLAVPSKTDVTWLLMGGILLNATSLQRQFYYSQVQVVVAAALAAALLLHVRKRPVAAAALVALVAGFKLYPIVLLPWFLFAGLAGWRDLSHRSLAVVGVAAVLVAVPGIGPWHSFVTDALPTIQRSVGGSLTNYSIPAMVNTLAPKLGGEEEGAGLMAIVQLLAKALGIAALALAYVVVWRRKLAPVPALGVLSAAMIAASLVCWSHYFVLMMLPVAWLWQRAVPPQAAGVQMVPLVAGALCLWPELDVVVPVTGSAWRMTLHYYPLLALAAVAILLASDGRSDEGEPASLPAAIQ